MLQRRVPVPTLHLFVAPRLARIWVPEDSAIGVECARFCLMITAKAISASSMSRTVLSSSSAFPFPRTRARCTRSSRAFSLNSRQFRYRTWRRIEMRMSRRDGYWRKSSIRLTALVAQQQVAFICGRSKCFVNTCCLIANDAGRPSFDCGCKSFRRGMHSC
jgi:hypothetical protein